MRRGSSGTGSALLAVSGEHGSWAFPSGAVAGVEPADGFEADPLPELATLLGAPASEPGRDARVLVLQLGGERQRIRVSGSLRLLEGAAVQLLALPREILAVSPFFSHMALLDGKPALFVVSPERLLESLRRAPNDDDAKNAGRGESC